MNSSNHKFELKLTATALAVATLLSSQAVTAKAEYHDNTDFEKSTAAKVEPAVNIAAQIPMYFLGENDNFLKLKPTIPNMEKLSVTGIAKVKPDTATLFVIDGNGKIPNYTIAQLLEQGHPIVALGSDLKVKQSVHQLLAGKVTKKIISGEIAANIEAPTPKSFITTDSDGQVYDVTLYGYYNGSELSQSYSSIEPDTAKVIAAAQQWATNAIASNKAKKEKPQTKALHPVWELEHQRFFTTADVHSPKGQLNVATMFYRLNDDGDSAFDWWTVEFKTEAIPGIHHYNSIYNYRTSHIIASVDADSFDSAHRLTEYGPAVSEPNCNGSIGGSLSGTGPDMDWGYSCTGSALYNYSNSSQDLAKWEHDYATFLHPVSEYAVMISPGAQIRVADGMIAPYLEFAEFNEAKFSIPVDSVQVRTTNDIGLSWTSSNVGKNQLANRGYHCTRVYEDSDPYSWDDNYMCVTEDIGMQYNQGGTISGMDCESIAESTDPHAWHDNHICLPTDADIELYFTSSNNGKNNLLNEGFACVSMIEVNDPHSWHDNYMCYRNKHNQTN